jgi:adenylate cyclase
VSGLPVGVAAHAGVAFVGNVGSGTVIDFTALGDAVNVGARLEAQARPGEVVLSKALYDLVADEHRDALVTTAELRGRDQSVEIATIRL